jgi:hypothetical protein
LSDNLIDEIERLIWRDPARRGLIGSEAEREPLCPGHLASAAENLARFGRRVAIVTGFYVPHSDPPAAETDGPPGAMLLAQVLELAGIEAFVITDAFCRSAVLAAAKATGFPLEKVLDHGGGARLGSPEDFNPNFWFSATVRYTHDSQGKIAYTEPPHATSLASADFSHLIAVERVGPSHTIESLLRQPRTGNPPLATFEAKVPPEHRDCCHNIRGEVIDDFAHDLDSMFDERRRLFREATTIGIGDGGNEIGMGSILWEELERRLSGEHSGWLPCRISTDWNIVAGTSNWGAYALAAAVLHLRGQADILRPFDARQQQRVVESMVAHGPAVDGVTCLREPTVDGLPFATYVQPWEGIRRVLGLE